jgi:PqqD family protein of HPr-rel-A system
MGVSEGRDREHAAPPHDRSIGEAWLRDGINPVPDSRVWRAVSPDGWTWATWDESYSLFNAETGDTHLLTDLAAMLLEATMDTPRSTEWLCHNAAALYRVPSDSAWASRIGALIESLEEIELIERTTV